MAVDHVLDDIELLILMKRNDPLKYFDEKFKKKISIHDESSRKLAEVTGQMHNVKSFRSEITDLLNKTNERV